MALLHLIKNLVQRNSQHYMLPNPYYNNISINNYKREILPKFMLTLHAYVTSSLTLLYMKIIAKEYCHHYVIIFLIPNSFVFDKYMDYKANMKCHIDYIWRNTLFNKNMIKIADIYVSISIPNINNLFII